MAVILRGYFWPCISAYTFDTCTTASCLSTRNELSVIMISLFKIRSRIFVRKHWTFRLWSFVTGWVTFKDLKTWVVNQMIVVYTPVKKCCGHQVGANSPDISLLSVKGRGIHISYTTTWRRFLEGQLFHGQGPLTNMWRQTVTCNLKYYTSATQMVLIDSRAGNSAWIPSNLVWYDIFLNCNCVVTRWQ